jgi:hypothetical protein
MVTPIGSRAVARMQNRQFSYTLGGSILANDYEDLNSYSTSTGEENDADRDDRDHLTVAFVGENVPQNADSDAPL